MRSLTYNAAALLLLVLFWSGTACDFLGGSNDTEEVIGFVTEDITATPPLVAPDTVQAGEPFEITVTTFGPNLCWQAAREEVVREPMRVTITPYDRAPAGNTACADAIAEMERTISAQFDTLGEAAIVVNGRTGWVNDPEPVTLTHTVTVE